MIWGDFFSAETRTMLVMLKMSNVQHEVRIIDQFLGDHKSEEYLNMNPTGQIPTITEGKFLVLGGYQVYMNFLKIYTIFSENFIRFSSTIPHVLGVLGRKFLFFCYKSE